jgi:hypothetical protein
VSSGLLPFWAALAGAWARTDTLAAGQLVVGFVTVEYDAHGTPHSDGRFYTDQGVAEDLASRRNRGEGEPTDPLDRWWVLPVMAQDPAAVGAAAQAAQLRIRPSTDHVS